MPHEGCDLPRGRRLRDLGHKLRRPEAEYLRGGLYELRASVRGVHYRVLYFFHGRIAAIVAYLILIQAGSQQ